MRSRYFVQELCRRWHLFGAEAGRSELNWGRPDRDLCPINGVSWNQARQFAQWVGADLPTEAQWEYAATSEGRAAIPME